METEEDPVVESSFNEQAVGFGKPVGADRRYSLPEIIELARKRRGDLVSERDRLEIEIRQLDAVIGVGKTHQDSAGLADLALSNASEAIPRKPDTSEGSSIAVDWVTPAEVVEAAKVVLSRKAVPIKRGELFEAVIDMGIRVPGDNPIKNFGTILWRSKDIVNTPDGYKLAT